MSIGDGWILTSDRLPAIDDALINSYGDGEVLAFQNGKQFIVHWNDGLFHVKTSQRFTHWRHMEKNPAISKRDAGFLQWSPEHKNSFTSRDVWNAAWDAALKSVGIDDQCRVAGDHNAS